MNRYCRFSLIFLIACSGGERIDGVEIRIMKVQQHPFFKDHKRKLLVQDSKGHTVDATPIYSDAGEGCRAFLYDAGTTFIVIDCNGQWYSISKYSGDIKKEDWQWQKPLPAKYIGTFVSSDKEPFYTLVREQDVRIEKVYKIKDPGN